MDLSRLPDRLEGVPLEEWVPALLQKAPSSQFNLHAHHDTNPWGWDGHRMVAELWRRGIAPVGIAAFDSGEFIDSIAALSRYAGMPIPCFIEALTLTPGKDEVWNDLPGRMYVEAGPFHSTEQASTLSTPLRNLARRRAEYQADRWNSGLDLGFDYRPDWNSLSSLGITEANLSRDLVEAVKSRSSDPGAVWAQVPGLDADPNDGNFARTFRNATMVADTAIARVPRTTEFYMTTEEFVRLADGCARYMYVGKSAGVEADRGELLDRIQAAGFDGLCAIPQRNLDTETNALDFARFMEMLDARGVTTILGTEVNALGQWWEIDLDREPFTSHRRLIDATWERLTPISN